MGRTSKVEFSTELLTDLVFPFKASVMQENHKQTADKQSIYTILGF